MNNDDEQFDSVSDNELLDDNSSNDQIFAEPPRFEASHSANIIEKLIHLSRFGNLLTLIVGNNGCGKSSLIEKFIASTDDGSLVCHIKSHPLLSIDQLFQQVIESFAGETTFTGIPLTANQYEEWADQLTSFPGNRILVIDDAEVLSTSVLHELCQLSAMQLDKETPHLHLILAGNYDLNNILEQASQGTLDEDGIYTIDIPALSEEESGEWLDYLFLDAGVIFLPEEDALQQMLENGQGNLALLKELAEEYASEHNDIKGFEDDPEPWKVSVVGYWFASLTVIIMLVLGLFFYQEELVELTGFGNGKEEQLVSKNHEVVFVSDKVVPATDNEIVVEEIESESDSALEASLVTESKAELDQESKTQSIENIEFDIVLAGEIQPEVRDSKTDGLIEIPVKVQSALTSDEEFLMSASDNDYAVQVIGVSKEGTARSFIQKYSLPKMLYYKRYLKGKELYTVILASYQTKADANKARDELSNELKKNGPWIKSLNIIKNEILEAQKLTKINADIY